VSILDVKGIKGMTKATFFSVLIIFSFSFIYIAVAGGGNSGAIWTTKNDCGDVKQDVNHYAIGEHVFINGANFDSEETYWEITGRPGHASCDPGMIVASGTWPVDASGAFCFDAYTVQPDDCGEYQVKFGVKGDNYRVIEVAVCSELNESACSSDERCEWCPQCSGALYNGDGDRCVEKGNCTRSCFFGQCGATCDPFNSCQDKCVGSTRYFSGTCDLFSSCSCSYSTEDCNGYDDCYSYDNGCEDRDYFCSLGGCDYTFSNRSIDQYGQFMNYCSGDSIRTHVQFDDYFCDGTCIGHANWINDSLMQDCSLLDGWYNISSEWISTGQCMEKEQAGMEYRDYTCGPNVTCIYNITNSTMVDTGRTRNKQNGTACDDGLWCTVNDVCTNGQCGGASRDCSSNNICGIATCFFNPDNINFTYDFRNPFTSVCDEEHDTCTTGNGTITHTCNKQICGAECESDDDCPALNCSETFEDFCNGTKLVEFDDDKILDNTTVSNLSARSCNLSACECLGAEALCRPPFTNTYCVKGVCGASCGDNSDCSNKCIGYLRYYSGTCNLTSACSCDYSIESCDRSGCYAYENGCEDRNYFCTTGGCEYNFTNRHADYNDSFADYCLGNVIRRNMTLHNFYCNQTCQDHTSYTDDQLVQNCDELDGWYNTSNTQWISTDQCNEKEQRQQEFRDYMCSDAMCLYFVIDTRLVDTGAMRHKPDGTVCNDGLWCTVDDECESGTCGGSQRPCFSNDVGRIASCFNDPDNINFTYDFRNPFISQCIEMGNDTGYCTSGDETIMHSCDKARCGAQCESDNDCPTSNCSVTFNDYCNSTRLVEFDSDKKLDNTTVTNSSAQSCNTDLCDCFGAEALCQPPQLSTYCVKGVCGATCTGNDDCENKCVNNVRYYSGSCDSCSCSWLSEDCSARNDNTSDIICINGTAINRTTMHLFACSPEGCEESIEISDKAMVNLTLPVPNKTIGDPKVICENDGWCDWKITMLTPITLSCENNATVVWRYALDGDWKEWHNSTSPVTILFPEESNHTLEAYCLGLCSQSEIDSENFKVDGTSFKIPLYKKWNLISVPFVLLDDNPEEVFSSIDDKIDSVWTYDSGTWLVWIPGLGGTLDSVQPGWGYWVLAKNDTTLIIGGALLSPAKTPPSHALDAGWNLIGYYGTDWQNYTDPESDSCGYNYNFSSNVYCSLNSLIDTQEGFPKWSSLWGFDNCGNDVTHWNNIIACVGSEWTNNKMYAGKGYWIEMGVPDGYAPATNCIWNDDFECMVHSG